MLQALFARMLTINVHTLCVANGQCIAGGLLINFAHDEAMMKDDPSFKCHLNELKFGMPIPFGMLMLSKMAASEATTRRLITGMKFST